MTNFSQSSGGNRPGENSWGAEVPYRRGAMCGRDRPDRVEAMWAHMGNFEKAPAKSAIFFRFQQSAGLGEYRAVPNGSPNSEMKGMKPRRR